MQRADSGARAIAAPVDLGEGVWHFQSPLWQTNSLLAVADGETLLCDPAYEPAEIEAIRNEAASRAGGKAYLVITHADFDHTCGIGYFDAEVVAGADTAEKIRSGQAAESLRTQGPDWGVTWHEEIRVDRVVRPPEELELDSFRVAALDAPSHGRDGTAFVLLAQGILCPGDHLSAITYPFLGGLLERKIEAQRRLLEALGRYELRWVVPGHGPPLEPAQARRIGEEDLAYLERLGEAAREARAEGLAPGYALLHVYAVEPPRETTADFEIYELRSSNARLVLEQLRA